MLPRNAIPERPPAGLTPAAAPLPLLPPFGFARARCGDCRQERLVAFSCKGRCVCPSCTNRRMAEVAAHLSDSVVPAVPVRQWVLSVPKRLRPHLMRDSELAGAVLRVLLRENST